MLYNVCDLVYSDGVQTGPVGKVMATLRTKAMLENSVIVFMLWNVCDLLYSDVVQAGSVGGWRDGRPLDQADARGQFHRAHFLYWHLAKENLELWNVRAKAMLEDSVIVFMLCNVCDLVYSNGVQAGPVCGRGGGCPQGQGDVREQCHLVHGRQRRSYSWHSLQQRVKLPSPRGKSLIIVYRIPKVMK